MGTRIYMETGHYPRVVAKMLSDEDSQISEIHPLCAYGNPSSKNKIQNLKQLFGITVVCMNVLLLGTNI